ncbi:hypothetical protein [Streptomyces flaveolus]|uniref:hypothetical protein n=1 Tax=Streptomyces flaveolus TaxID=67297 RepID=UPI003F4B20F4
MAGQTPRRGLRLNQPEPMALLTVHGFEAARRKTVSAIRAHDVREPGAGLGRPGRPERTPRCRPIAARRPGDGRPEGPGPPRQGQGRTHRPLPAGRRTGPARQRRGTELVRAARTPRGGARTRPREASRAVRRTTAAAQGTAPPAPRQRSLRGPGGWTYVTPDRRR